MSDNEVKSGHMDFLGIRVLTPLEELAVSGGGDGMPLDENPAHDHDHQQQFNQHSDHDHT